MEPLRLRSGDALLGLSLSKERLCDILKKAPLPPHLPAGGNRPRRFFLGGGDDTTGSEMRNDKDCEESEWTQHLG